MFSWIKSGLSSQTFNLSRCRRMIVFPHSMSQIREEIRSISEDAWRSLSTNSDISKLFGMCFTRWKQKYWLAKIKCAFLCDGGIDWVLRLLPTIQIHDSNTNTNTNTNTSLTSHRNRYLCSGVFSHLGPHHPVVRISRCGRGMTRCCAADARD